MPQLQGVSTSLVLRRPIQSGVCAAALHRLSRFLASRQTGECLGRGLPFGVRRRRRRFGLPRPVNSPPRRVREVSPPVTEALPARAARRCPNGPANLKYALTPWGHAGTLRTRRAFTLVEIILAAAIIALLAGTFVVAMGQWYQKQALDESALRVEAILRMARAEACSQGRLIRLAFDPASGAPVIGWEPNPLQEPGRFVPHYGAWANDLPTDRLRFIQCRRTGQSARKLLTYSDAQEPETPDGEPLQSVTFMPDGSCDSAIVEVAAADGLDPRIGRIEINGITGSVELRMLTLTEQAEQQEIDAEAEEAP